MIRTLHVNGKWLAQNLTGTQRYAAEVVRAISETGRVALVLHVPAGAEPPEWSQREGFEVRRAPVGGVLFEQVYLPLVTAGKMLLNLAGPAQLAKRRQLVAMHDATPFRFPQTFRKAFVRFYFVMYFWLGRVAEHLVTVSHFSARELAEVLRLDAGKFVVAGCAANAITEAAERRPDLELPESFCLVVGTLAVHKNLAEPLEAIAGSGRDVVVVGISGNQQVFSSTAAVDEHAIVPGRLSDGELVWLYRHATALVFPSKYEGFGLPPLEAQGLGCVVVSSNAASLPEICGDAALYFDPDDAGQLLSQLDRLDADPALGEDLRRRGLVNAQRFSWSESAAKILEVVGIR